MKRKKWLRKLVKRRVFVALLILIQLIFIVLMISTTAQGAHWVNAILVTMSFVVTLNVISRKGKAAYKLLWVILLFTIPIFGGLFYLLIRYQASTKWFERRQNEIWRYTRPLIESDRSYVDEATANFSSLPQYLENYAGFPVYKNTGCQFFASGEENFEAMLAELRKAEKYIFMEYFIISEGKMWNAILGILKEKAAAGVDVRLIYDDMGSLMLLPKNYPQTLAKMGIKCQVFNPFRPVLSSLQNNRDHRKITAIDGRVAFTGGMNIADEYVNSKVRFGHWKDCGVKVEGEAAWSFAVIFLEIWSMFGTGIDDIVALKPDFAPSSELYDGYVQPYSDSPLDSDNVSEHVYMHIINKARKYLYINTPYLIIDDSMTSALILAAKSGVDVRICTPHIWDKWAVHMTSRAHYRDLIRGGVKIYEYTDGFNHAKTFLADDTMGVVGTVNLDFRSLYLHFECGTCIYDAHALLEMKEDYLATLRKCEAMTLEKCKANPLMLLFQDVMRVFEPLL